MSQDRLKLLAIETCKDPAYPMGSKPRTLAHLILLHLDPEFFSDPLKPGELRKIEVSKKNLDHLDTLILRDRECLCHPVFPDDDEEESEKEPELPAEFKRKHVNANMHKKRSLYDIPPADDEPWIPTL